MGTHRITTNNNTNKKYRSKHYIHNNKNNNVLRIPQSVEDNKVGMKK